MVKNPKGQKPKSNRPGKAIKTTGHFTVNTVARGHGLRADELRVTENGCLLFFVRTDPNPVLVVARHAYSHVLGGSLDDTGTWQVEPSPSQIKT
jgi:hypothetical protein